MRSRHPPWYVWKKWTYTKLNCYLYHLRVDGYCNSFSIIYLLNDKNKFYFKPLSLLNYETTLKQSLSFAYKQYNKKGSIANYVLGSTIFASKYPKLWNPYHEKYSMLPRPYKSCQTNGDAKKIWKDPWFKNLLLI